MRTVITSTTYYDNFLSLLRGVKHLESAGVSISDISLNTQLYHVGALDVVMDGKGVLQIIPLLSPKLCHIPGISILKLKTLHFLAEPVDHIGKVSETDS